VREAQVFRPALRAAFIVNRRVSATVIGREARSALADQPLPALHSEVHQRIVFADSVAAGQLAREAAPRSAAAREIAALVDELLRWPICRLRAANASPSARARLRIHKPKPGFGKATATTSRSAISTPLA